MNRKNICLAAAEAVPFIKAGGMADVVGSLYKYLKGKQNVSLFIPLYKQTKNSHKTTEIGIFDVVFSEHRKEKCILEKSIEFPGIYFINNPGYFKRDGIYGHGGKGYPDNAERFSFLPRAVLEAARFLKIDADVFHCHDWHTALLPLYLKTNYRDIFPRAKTLFTIHNLGYQGVFSADTFQILGLPWHYFQMEELEFYGNVNFMKAAIIHSDMVNTVSPRYAKEILTPEFGNSLDGLLRKNQNKLRGIINGIDYQIWNPSFDRFIHKKYRTFKSKSENKTALQKKLGLQDGKDIPLFGMVARLAEQKGIDELAEIMGDILSKNLQVVVLGDGEPEYKDILTRWAGKFPKKISVAFGFNDELAHLIYAGSDFFLMPSKFEPCGLGQMISFKYGTIPVVRNVGGLADTVANYDFASEKGTGFVFEGGSRELLKCIESALKLFGDEKRMEKCVNSVIKLDFSWKSSVNEYLEIYGQMAEL
ncbi:MAG: glycogen synthase GlgA [Candidatus Omnitrophica bacterium]|nr:glycogen synthase GlgA [Candidatus Omnitrophota bacterium]